LTLRPRPITEAFFDLKKKEEFKQEEPVGRSHSQIFNAIFATNYKVLGNFTQNFTSLTSMQYAQSGSFIKAHVRRRSKYWLVVNDADKFSEN